MLIFIIIILVVLAIVVFINKYIRNSNQKLSNNLIDEQINTTSVHTNTTSIIKEYYKLEVEDSDNINNIATPMDSFNKLGNNYIVNQPNYYIVKETKADVIANTIFNSKEYIFSDEDFLKSKSDARLFYDAKVADESKNDVDCLTYFEIYIINNILPSNYSTDINNNDGEIKMYLLVDMKGNIVKEGKDFETFVIQKITQAAIQNQIINKSTYTTKNSFLDGNYKD